MLKKVWEFRDLIFSCVCFFIGLTDVAVVYAQLFSVLHEHSVPISRPFQAGVHFRLQEN